MSKPLRIGIISTAKIARAFVAAVKPSNLANVVAVASRDAGRAEDFSREFGIAKPYRSYEALLADPDIDAIYNPLPNTMHAEWSIKAAKAGKHVLCEKPLAMSAAEASAMFAAAKSSGVHLVEAYPYLAQPQTLKVRDLVRSGAIGRVQLIRASFGVNFTDPNNIRLKPDLGGGSLMDAGSYPVSFVRAVAGERPSRVQATARWTTTGVDNTLIANIEFTSGLVAQISSSFATGYHRHAQIMGDKGTLETTFLNHPPIGGPAALQIRRGIMVTDPIETITTADGNGFLAETESFARMITSGPSAWTGATPDESIDIAGTLTAMLESARSGRAVDVAIA